MIEHFLTQREQAVPYALAVGAIVLSVILGYMLGHTPAEQLCAEHIVEAQEQKKYAVELNEQLTACQAKKAGGAVLECKYICDDQVAKALKNHKDLLCED